MRLEGGDGGRQLAKSLRRELTPPEIALWLALRRSDSGLRFRRQHPAGDYVLDFYCAPARLAIEVDGAIHECGDRRARDARRDTWLASCGVRVVRYSARDVLANTEGVVTQVVALAAARSAAFRLPPPPSPSAPPPPVGGGLG